MSPAAFLRSRLTEGQLLKVMAAHSPLSAKLVEESGFDGVWASGFELAALYGVADVSLVTMTQHLDMVRAMADHTRLPIIADIDTGFGNAVNVDYAIRQYERAGAAAVVIEDKMFPKVTSLIEGGRQDLISSTEFEGKIGAALAARRSPEFVVVARTEALIAGLGHEEALRRARAYADAGADLILIHSKAKSPDEILAFISAWDRPNPIVLVPTSYPDLTNARIEALRKVGIVIYGNHAIRASVRAMQAVFAQVVKDGGIHTLGDSVVPVDEVFRLQDMAHIRQLEQQFI
ncbi:phosphonopyruvate hydrolase [Burkholderia cepacia]|uniref:phosphonopyruvate hydrolase n=1 Tax=Burkholderia cepacia TaxID=292 RepID=UPI002AB7BF9D|nr:phosphonopyruvate hydrolase [Burkholderia cepacia]